MKADGRERPPHHSHYPMTEATRMDVTEFMETSISLNGVKNSPTKRLVILSGGASKLIEGKNKLNMLVEMDGKNLTWLPNKTTLQNIAAKHGKESSQWIGKQVSLEIGSVNGKEAVIGRPI